MIVWIKHITISKKLEQIPSPPSACCFSNFRKWCHRQPCQWVSVIPRSVFIWATNERLRLNKTENMGEGVWVFECENYGSSHL